MTPGGPLKRDPHPNATIMERQVAGHRARRLDCDSSKPCEQRVGSASVLPKAVLGRVDAGLLKTTKVSGERDAPNLLL